MQRIVSTVLLLLLMIFLFVKNASATCDSPISRTNNAANSILTSSKYNTDVNTVYTHTNDLNGSCITDNTIGTEEIDTSSLGPQFNAIHHGFKCTRSAADTIAISKGYITVNGNNIRTTTATSITFGCGGCSSESTGTSYYVALKTGTTEDPVITTTAPDEDGYSGTSKYLCKFANDYNGDIATEGITQWATNGFSGEKSYLETKTGGGYGATNNKIRYMTTIVNEWGDGITYTTSSTNGDSYTMNADGILCAVRLFSHSVAGGCGAGFSKNSNQLTTTSQSILVEDRIMFQVVNTGNPPETINFCIPVKSGDVIRPHDDGGCNQTNHDYLRMTLMHNK